MKLLANNLQRILGIVFLTVGITAQTVNVQTESGLNVTLGGEVEMEFIDVEGPGGFSNQDLTVKKVKNRSPHMRIDKAILSAKIFIIALSSGLGTKKPTSTNIMPG